MGRRDAKDFSIDIKTFEIDISCFDNIEKINFWQIGTLLEYTSVDKYIKKPETQEMVSNYRTALRKRD